MIKKYFYVVLLSATIVSLLSSCSEKRVNSSLSDEVEIPDLLQYVNPFVGTKNMGHTYPGATTPFGMVQLSPETNIQQMYIDGKYNTETYRYCQFQKDVI